MLVQYGSGWSRFYQLSGLGVFCCVLFVRNWEFDERSPSVWSNRYPRFSCIMYCYNSYRQLTSKNLEVNSVPYVSQQREKSLAICTWDFPWQYLFISATRVMVCRYWCIETRVLLGSNQVVILIVVTLVNYY